MSSVDHIGSRLNEVRSRLNYPQSKVAAALGIADKSYKNYETGKRELPLSTAIAFCKTFNVDLNWLVRGEPSLDRGIAGQTIEESVTAVLNEIEKRSLAISTPRIAKVCAFLAMQCLANGTKPADEVAAVMDLII